MIAAASNDDTVAPLEPAEPPLQNVELEEVREKTSPSDKSASLFQRVFASISWIYRAFVTVFIMFLFKLFAFFNSCFMTLPVLLPINAHPSKDNTHREGGSGPIVPYWIETKIKFWCFLHIVFNIQVPASWVKASYAKLIELNKDVRDAETQGVLSFFYVCLFHLSLVFLLSVLCSFPAASRDGVLSNFHLDVLSFWRTFLIRDRDSDDCRWAGF